VVYFDVYKLKLDNESKLHPIFHVSKLKLFVMDFKNLHPNQELRPKKDSLVWKKLINVIASTIVKNMSAISYGVLRLCPNQNEMACQEGYWSSTH
jgi:hypothetical protein